MSNYTVADKSTLSTWSAEEHNAMKVALNSKADAIDTSFETLTYASTLSVPFDPERPNKKITLTGNIAITNTDTSNGSAGLYEIIQDSTPRTVSINGTSVTVNEGSGESTLIGWFYNGATYTFDTNAVQEPTSPEITINTQTSSYTLVLGDATNTDIQMDVASANNVTFPQNSSVAIPIGSSGIVTQKGEGQTTIVAGTGATVNAPEGCTLNLLGQKSKIFWEKIGTNEFDIAGDLEPTTAPITQSDLDEKQDKAVTINTQTASYTLVLTDAGKSIEMNVASGNNLTVPPNSTVAFDIGTIITIWQLGAGQTTIVPDSGVTILSAGSRYKINEQYGAVTLEKRATDTWKMAGNTAV